MTNKKRGRIVFYKKGMTHEMFFNLFELVLAFIVILALFNFVNDVAENTIFEKNYLARDLAIVINTLYAAPGEVAFSYGENSNQPFILDFKQNSVEIYEPEEKTSEQHISYQFAENNNMHFMYKILAYGDERVEINFLKANEYLNVNKIAKTSLIGTGGRSGGAGSGGEYEKK